MAVTSAAQETVVETRIATRGFNLGRLTGSVSTYAILIAFLLIFLVPFIWIWSSAFKTSQEIGRNPFALPTELRWENLVEAGRWAFLRVHAQQRHLLRGDRRRQGGPGLPRRVRALHAPLPGREGAGAVPARADGAVPVGDDPDVLPAARHPTAGDVLGVHHPRHRHPAALRHLPHAGFFRGLPPELGDAARTDGANEWGVFRQVMLPALSWPGLATLIVFQFMWAWNEFAMPLIFVQRDELRPVSLGTMFFFGRFTADRGMIAAGVTMSMIPVVILYLILQRRFIEGITGGRAEELAPRSHSWCRRRQLATLSLAHEVEFDHRLC